MQTKLWTVGLALSALAGAACSDSDASGDNDGAGNAGAAGIASSGMNAGGAGGVVGAGGSGGRAGSGDGGAVMSGGTSGRAAGGNGAGGAGGSGATDRGGAAAVDGGEAGDGPGAAGGEAGAPGGAGGPSDACAPAVERGEPYFDFPERFNRYYTDCAYQPSSIVYVGPDGTGDGSSRAAPANVASALSEAVPGRQLVFVAGTYSGCFELDADQSGTYDAPIVLAGERNDDGSLAVTIHCCDSGRKTCFNLEAADYVAIDGFELVGGDYGVRAVGAGYAADEHQKGIAVLNNVGHGQYKDPFFTGQSDWFVIQSSTAYDSGSGDGHGIYLSNGSDWNIARWNETYATASSDFQINADPASTCADEGIDYDDPECDAVAGSHVTGGRGASDFMLIDGNFFHHSLAQGPNFTSVRHSVVRNNIFGLPARHGVSFWQETDNPELGSSHNVIAHNLFITNVSNRQAVQFANASTDNRFANNVVVAISASGGTASANPDGQLLATDSTTVQANTFEHNAWISGYFGSEDGSAEYSPNENELRLMDFEASWFAALSTEVGHDPAAFAPGAAAPWLDSGEVLAEVPTDRAGATREAPVDLGPYER